MQFFWLVKCEVHDTVLNVILEHLSILVADFNVKDF
jgi:hypothetical protein